MWSFIKKPLYTTTDLSNIIEVSVRDSFLLCQLSYFIEQDVKFELGLKVFESLEAETLQRTISNHSAQKLQVRDKLLQVNCLEWIKFYRKVAKVALGSMVTS